ncbi:MAG: S8 family serine peptidase [Bdellovibrionales bacterium]|nr:S8 family serine peptidase [Bdellovibrionales bacterium]
MNIHKSILVMVSVASLALVGCGRSQQIQQAPTSQDEVGIIVSGQAGETQAVIEQSSEFRVISEKHHIYEVKGLSLAEVQKIAPNAKAEANRYYKEMAPRANPQQNKIEAYRLAMDGNVPSDLPPALQGCDMQVQPTPAADIGLSNNVLGGSKVTMELGETPIFNTGASAPHPDFPGTLEFRWDVIAPGLSSIPSEVRLGKEFSFTPDAVGSYQIVLVVKDERNACAAQVGRFLVTANPKIEYAQVGDPMPTVDLKHFTHLKKVEAIDAWNTATGKGVVVAVLDTGLHYNHPAIKFNLAVNESEKNGTQGQDDDGNEFVDDALGWDFVNSDNLPFDDEGHGSHVSGLVASHIMGAAKGAKVLPVKVMNAGGGGDVATVIAGIYYAADRGVNIINASLGAMSTSFSTMKDAIDYANSKGVLFVAAAGNGDANGNGIDLSAPGMDVYPAEIDSVNILSVAALGADNGLTSYSNFGEDQVDVAAPGGDAQEPIFSLATMNTKDAAFVASGGTSMASPIVAGIAALALEVHPQLKPVELRNLLMGVGTEVEAIAGKVGSGKIISALQAVSPATPLQ